MKRFFLTLLVAAIVFPLWAADIIVTTSSERIDAKIEEVSETEVKYKKADKGKTMAATSSVRKKRFILSDFVC